MCSQRCHRAGLALAGRSRQGLRQPSSAPRHCFEARSPDSRPAWDYVVIDCSLSLGLLAIAAFAARVSRCSSASRPVTASADSHGHEPAWVNGSLAPASRAALHTVDLHFHDLRHEAGCRWLKKGWPLHHIQEMLGHANLSQTSTYLHAAEMGLQESMRRFDDPAHGKPVANDDQIEQRPLSHNKPETDSKDRLH
jgi:Phage integrase family